MGSKLTTCLPVVSLRNAWTQNVRIKLIMLRVLPYFYVFIFLLTWIARLTCFFFRNKFVVNVNSWFARDFGLQSRRFYLRLSFTCRIKSYSFIRRFWVFFVFPRFINHFSLLSSVYFVFTFKSLYWILFRSNEVFNRVLILHFYFGALCRIFSIKNVLMIGWIVLIFLNMSYLFIFLI